MSSAVHEKIGTSTKVAERVRKHPPAVAHRRYPMDNEQRTCEGCGIRYSRPRNISRATFAQRKYCTRACWHGHQHRQRGSAPDCRCGCGRPTTWEGHSRGWRLYAPGCYVPHRKPNHAPWIDDGSGFWDWLAGFLDGEGYFGFIPRHIKRQYYSPVLKVSLRADDRAILEEIRDRTGCGRVRPQDEYGTSRPQARWAATSMADCVRLIEILDAHPLRAKKAGDYAIWREAVLEKDQNGNTERLDKLVERLVAGRQWKADR